MKPSKYPDLEAALARTGLTKKSLADELGITARTLSYKLADGKLSKAEQIAAAHLLEQSAEMHPSAATPECISIPVMIGGQLIETITVPKQTSLSHTPHCKPE